MDKVKSKIFLLILFIIMIFSANRALATHAAAADLTYECLGNNQYRIELTFYRDCEGTSAPLSPSVDLDGCGTNTSQSLSFKSGVTQGEILDLVCDQERTTCDGGSYPGIRKYVYDATITVPGNCPNFIVSYDLCCRNYAITNLQSPGNQDIYVEALINNSNGYCNNSPVFFSDPIEPICVGDTFNYNHSAVDVDGDQLVYSSVNPKDDPNITIPFVGGYSPSNPLDVNVPFSINSSTGQLVLNPASVQNGIISVLVEEYRNGVLVGSVIREMQAIVLNCNNNSPDVSGINGANTGTSQDYTLSFCSGSNVCFDIFANDNNNDSITTINISDTTDISGAQFQVSGPPSNKTINFCWDPVSAGATPGTYSFRVVATDNGCPFPQSNTQTFTLIFLGGNLSVDAVGSSLTCRGDNNGVASATLNGGDPPFTFEWNTNPPQNSLNASNLEAGVYTFEVTDSGGCIATDTALVSQPDSLIFDFVNTPAVCNGQQNGTITLNLSGGNPSDNYLYNWSVPGVGDTNYLDSLASGAYFVTVTDDSGCVTSSNTFIFQPGPLVINLNASSTADYNGRDISCTGAADGEITVIATGGTTPYDFQWTPNANGQDSSVIQNLTAGTYSVTVSDSNGCNTGTTLSIQDPPPLSVSSDVASNYNGKDISCFDSSDGSATVLPGGGTPPYTYQWDASSGSQTNDTAVGLSAGLYNVTVFDANLCPIDTSVLITPPDSLSLEIDNITSFNGFEIACNNGDDGAVFAAHSGGTNPRIVSWSNGVNTSRNENLSTGTYSVTITDMNGCQIDDSVTLNEPPPIVLNLSVTSDYNGFDVSCYGSMDGEVTSTVSGGVPGYKFDWNPSGFSEDSIIDSLEANRYYYLTLSDSNECSITDSIILSQPDSILLDPQIVSDYNGYAVSCFGANDGVAEVSGIGGTGSYTFEWEDGQTNTQATSLSAGEWVVSATDQNACMQDTVITLDEPDSLAIDLSIASDYNGSAISCFGASDGSLFAEADGGVNPYDYNWSGANQQTYSGVAEGTYPITVTDDNNCVTVDSIFIDDPDSLIALASGVDVICTGDINGRAVANVEGGTPIYSYSWDDPATQSTQEATGLAPGTYNLSVTDVNGCSDVAQAMVGEPDSLLLSLSSTDPICNGNGDGTASVDIVGGVSPYAYSWNNANRSTVADIDQLFAGTYTVEVTDSTGCVRTATAILNNPPEIDISADAGPSQIRFGQTSSLISTVSNNVVDSPGSDQYQWSPVDGLNCSSCPGPTATPLETTTYSVVYTDSRGCEATDEVTVEVDIYNRILFVPNAFTPNGDDNNDVFRIYGEGIQDIEWGIYDRWGQILYQSSSLEDFWDGTFKGEDKHPGVYIYYANIVYEDGYEEEKKGSVTLIR